MIVCKICGYSTENKQSFNSHITHKHHIKSKEYYDEFLKQPSEGICPSCGKETKFKDMWYGYNKHCSARCIPLDPAIQEKMKQTCQERYGTDYAWQAEQTKDKIRKTTKEHFGVECYLQTNDCRKIIAKVSGSDKVKEKIRQTNLKKRNVACSFQDMEVIRKSRKARILNNNGSSLESYMMTKLNELNIKFEPEYNLDSRYPYFCDFYIPEKDIFIELHGFWMHGHHWFDSNNPEDIKCLNSWIEKSKTNSVYKAAIDCWTKIDIEKRNCAIKNKINYVVLWNKNEVDDWIKNNF